MANFSTMVPTVLRLGIAMLLTSAVALWAQPPVRELGDRHLSSHNADYQDSNTPGRLKPTPQRRALLIGIDGLRWDALERAMQLDMAPNLAQLANEGAYYGRASISDLTFSGPGWTDILAGVHRDLHRVETNSVTGNQFSNSNQSQFLDLLALVKASDPNLRTARWTTWSPLSTTRTPGGTDYNFYHPYDQDGDRIVAEDAARFFTEDEADVAFFYLGDVDIVGHARGFNPRIGDYLAEIANTDDLIGGVLSAIRARPGFIDGTEDWLFVVSTDHGGNLGRGHAGNRPWDRRIFLIINGGGAPLGHFDFGGKGVDIVPTILDHLELPAPSYLAGRSLLNTGDPRPPAEANNNLLFNGDADWDHGFPSPGYDQTCSGWNEYVDANYLLEQSVRTGDASVTIVRYGSPGVPGINSPGPIDRGHNFFTGASGASNASMTQRLDLSPLRELIQGRRAGFLLSGYLGGVNSSTDRADVTCIFRDVQEREVGYGEIGPVTADDRQGISGLWYREYRGYVPPDAVVAEVTLNIYGRQACADDLRLVIEDLPSFPAIVAFDTFDEWELKPFEQVVRIGDGTDYTAQIPGWLIDNSGMSSVSLEPAYDGATAMDVDSWIAEQGVQIGRGSTGRFGVGQRNTALVFDPDAWADFSGAEQGGYHSRATRTVALPADADPQSFFIEFDWEFASEDLQRAEVEISFDAGQTWQTLLVVDSASLPANQVSGDRSRYRAGQQFQYGGRSLMIRFSLLDAGNNWWFAVDNLRLGDNTRTLVLDDFEGLNLQPFTLANQDSIGDGSDYTDEIPFWTVDNSQMAQTSSEPAYQGWRVLDVDSWMEEQAGQERSVFGASGLNQALVADADAWADYISNPPGSGFHSSIYRDYDLRGFRPDTLLVGFDWEFRSEDSQRGVVEISFDGGNTYQILLDLDSDGGQLNNGQVYFGPGWFQAGVDFQPSSYFVRLRITLRDAGNNWWFAVDNVVLQASPTTVLAGDANGDGQFDFLDIDPFVMALVDPASYLASYPGIDPDFTLDMNLDGRLDFADIDAFVEALL